MSSPCSMAPEPILIAAPSSACLYWAPHLRAVVQSSKSHCGVLPISLFKQTTRGHKRNIQDEPLSSHHDHPQLGHEGGHSPSIPELNNQIPQLGFGVYQSPPEQTTKTVSTAIEAGYRHIDSAQWYL